MFPYVQDFSSGYYIMSPMFVEPYNVSSPRINDRVYQYLQSNVFKNFDRVILKCRTQVFEVEPSRSISTEVLALPLQFINDKLEVVNPPDEVVTYVAKKEVGEALLGLDQDQDLVEFDAWDRQ